MNVPVENNTRLWKPSSSRVYRVTRNVKQAVHVAEDPPKREETRRLSRCQRRSSAITISTAIHESPGNKYPRTGSPSRFCSSSSIYILRATSYRLHVPGAITSNISGSNATNTKRIRQQLRCIKYTLPQRKKIRDYIVMMCYTRYI